MTTTITTSDATNELFAVKCKKIRGLLNAAEMRGAIARYDIGVEVQQAKDDEAKYGKSAVARIADVVKCTGANLYEYARVANAWPREEFEKLTKRKSASGANLTFSHLAAIAMLGDKSDRAALVDECLEKDLSVRDVKALVADPKKPKPAKAARPMKPGEAAKHAASVLVAGVAGLRAVLDAATTIKDASLDEILAVHAAYEEARSLFERVGAEVTAIKGEKERESVAKNEVVGEEVMVAAE